MEPLEDITWGKRSLGNGTRTRLFCGRLLVELSKRDDEICLASKLLDDQEFEALRAGDASALVKWTRWVACSGTDAVTLVPHFPTHPVLVEPAEPFHVLPGAQARIWVRIPLLLAVRVAEGDDQILGEFPTEALSETWFGDAESGELCFWLGAAVSREIDGGREDDRSGIHAPVVIRNESTEVLQVQRVCLRVSGLSVYHGDGWLWASETVVRYQGGPSPSRINIKHGPPPESPTATLVAGPRQSADGTIVARTFRSLRRWTADLLEF